MTLNPKYCDGQLTNNNLIFENNKNNVTMRGHKKISTL